MKAFRPHLVWVLTFHFNLPEPIVTFRYTQHCDNYASFELVGTTKIPLRLHVYTIEQSLMCQTFKSLVVFVLLPPCFRQSCYILPLVFMRGNGWLLRYPNKVLSSKGFPLVISQQRDATCVSGNLEILLVFPRGRDTKEAIFQGRRKVPGNLSFELTLKKNEFKTFLRDHSNFHASKFAQNIYSFFVKLYDFISS